jgi:hypothetical protein
MELKSVGMMTFPIYGTIKNGPNHQPEDDMGIEYDIVFSIIANNHESCV